MRDMQENVNSANSALYKKQLKTEFKKINRRTLSKLSDEDLALWQSEYQPLSPQSIIAEREWQRRLTVEQIRGSRFAAYIGILGTIIGSFSTWLISQW